METTFREIEAEAAAALETIKEGKVCTEGARNPSNVLRDTLHAIRVATGETPATVEEAEALLTRIFDLAGEAESNADDVDEEAGGRIVALSDAGEVVERILDMARDGALSCAAPPCTVPADLPAPSANMALVFEAAQRTIQRFTGEQTGPTGRRSKRTRAA